ncbi:hypothetical protein [Roseobacter weihaiensis]|nr:hypothetical protein [Roseobacter sp. H9]
MKEIVLAFAAMALISVGASFALHEVGFSSAEQTSGNAVRLD